MPLLESKITTTFASSQQLGSSMEVMNNNNQAFSSSSSSSIWLYGLIDSQLKSASQTMICSSSSGAGGPDLELTLAAPRASNLEYEQTKKASTGSLLVDPIRVP